MKGKVSHFALHAIDNPSLEEDNHTWQIHKQRGFAMSGKKEQTTQMGGPDDLGMDIEVPDYAEPDTARTAREPLDAGYASEMYHGCYCREAAPSAE